MGSAQANAAAAMQASTEMQDACIQLYDKLAGLDALAKQVKELRHSVERLEIQLNTKLKVWSKL